MLAGFVVVLARLAVARLRRVTVRGESMTPTLRPGARVVVWRPLRRPRPGWVIVYRDRFDGGLRIKRVATIGPDGSLRVRGDNAVLSTAERDLGPVDPAQVVGVPVFRPGTGGGPLPLRYHRRR